MADFEILGAQHFQRNKQKKKNPRSFNNISIAICMRVDITRSGDIRNNEDVTIRNMRMAA